MIPRSLPVQQTVKWQKELSEAVTDPGTLLDILKIARSDDISLDAARTFPLRVPHSFIARMRPGNQDDPLLKQVLPITKELEILPGYSSDPLQESQAMPVAGLLHKYAGRVLLTVTGACAVHCRYCFRRHFPYADANPGRDKWQAALDYITDSTDVNEVILSGGDPLSLTDKKLTELINRLELIPHLSRLRIHTRLPVVIPSRLTDELISCLTNTRLKTIIVLHINHANETNTELQHELQKLAHRNITLLNQSVLLKGVNDSVVALHDLSEALFESGVLPYYLHQLDPVAGAGHFAVEDTTAKQLYQKLQAQLPGFLLPRLVREEPDQPSKQVL